MSSNGNSCYINNDEQNRPVAIRAGLSVQELKMMTAMRMAQNSGDQINSIHTSNQTHNPSSSYQTANPQQLRAAGIQPVVFNERNSRNRQVGRALQIAGQFSAEQYTSGQFSSSNRPNGSSSHYPQSEYSSHRGAAHNNPLPVVYPRHMAVNEPLLGRRRNIDGNFSLESAAQSDRGPQSQQFPPLSRYQGGSEGNYFVSSPSGLDFPFEDASSSRVTSSRYFSGESAAPPTTRSNSVASLQHPTAVLLGHDSLGRDFLGPKSTMNGPYNSRSPLASEGRPEVLSVDDDLSSIGSSRLFGTNGVVGPTHRQDSSFRDDDIFTANFDAGLHVESNRDYLMHQTSGKQAEINGRKVALLKSRSEALFSADQLSMFQNISHPKIQNSLLPDSDSPRNNGLFSVASEATLQTALETVDPPISSPTKSRFPLLKAKTTPKFAEIQFMGVNESPSNSPSLKLFGRKKCSPGPANEMFLASEVAESVLDASLLDGENVDNDRRSRTRAHSRFVESEMDRLIGLPFTQIDSKYDQPIGSFEPQFHNNQFE